MPNAALTTVFAMRRRQRLLVAGLAAMVLSLAVGLPFLGVEIRVTWADVMAGPDATTNGAVFYRWRLPRVLAGLAVGAGLALAGALVQTIFRNDLATPYTLGMDGGAALGVVLAARWLDPTASLGVARFAGGLAGGAAAALLVLGLTRGGSRRLDLTALILAGVTVNALAGALIALIQYLANPYDVYAMLRLLSGGLDGATMMPAVALGAGIVLGVGVALMTARWLQSLELGDAAAMALGVSAVRWRLAALAGALLLTAGCVAIAGPIGFVGFMVPHAARRLVGGSLARVIPVAALLGAAFLPLCDAIARLALHPVQLPVGLVTGLLGAPWFLVILVMGRYRSD